MGVWSIITPIIIGLFLFGAGCTAYWFYVRSRPKKLTWIAYVYEKVGSLSKLRDGRGKIIEGVDSLESVKLIGIDLLEKLDFANGLSPYRLKRANAPIQDVKGEHTDTLPDGKRTVKVLRDGDSYSLLTAGVDKWSRLVFRAVPYDLSNMALNAYHIKMNRNKEKKDNFTMLMGLASIIVVVFGLVACSYFIGQAWIKGMETQKEVAITFSAGTTEMAKATRELAGQYNYKGVSPNLPEETGRQLGVVTTPP